MAFKAPKPSMIPRPISPFAKTRDAKPFPGAKKVLVLEKGGKVKGKK